MRLPALVCSQAALLIVSLAYLEMYPQDPAGHWHDWLVRAIVPRCAILTLGTCLDFVRRCNFQWERQALPPPATA
jgi:hypothetical protein